MDKLKMQSKDITQGNIEQIKKLFPNCVSEGKVDFDLLRQELSSVLVEGKDERYRLDWAGKRQAILTANSPIAKTLRPAREESVNFDTTENLYIEGDNLDVLKLLHETYLGKVKMIYIDPPYNTGNDFVYNDDFAEDASEYFLKSNQVDDQGKRLETNKETSGRFHSDWLSMMFMRLKLAKDLLTEDGVIFISIDDNEQANLKRICDEVFGGSNFVACLPTVMNLKGNNDQFGFAGTHEYTLVYIKDINSIEDLNGIDLTLAEQKEYDLEDEKGKYKQGATLMRTGEAGAREFRPKGYYPIYVKADLSVFSTKRMNNTDIEVYPKTKNGTEMSWRRSPENLENTKSEFIIKQTREGISFYKKQRLEDDMRTGKKAKTLFYKEKYSSGNGTALMVEYFKGRVFDNPKPLELIKDFVRIGSNRDSIVMDFFSGSATTAHAVMELNSRDAGNRKFIMVQLPEPTEPKSEAFKAGYKNICEIAKERLRIAGREYSKTSGVKDQILEKAIAQIKIEYGEDAVQRINIDYGFRVLKLDDSNMRDVFYNPKGFDQSMILGLDNSIKEDRTAEDILFQVMRDKGVSLSSKIEKKTTANGQQTYYILGETGFGIIDLICCLDKKINTDAVKEIAKLNAECVVFLDSGMENDATRTNIQQVFDTYSPKTKVEVL